MSTKLALDGVPKEILCGPYRYSIEFDGEASYDYSFLGVCLNKSRRIKLDPRQSDTELPATLLHEVLHAVGCAFEIKEWAHHRTDDKGNVTDQIDLMSTVLLQLIRDNPGFIKWLQEQR